MLLLEILMPIALVRVVVLTWVVLRVTLIVVVISLLLRSLRLPIHLHRPLVLTVLRVIHLSILTVLIAIRVVLIILLILSVGIGRLALKLITHLNILEI